MYSIVGFPRGFSGQESASNEGDLGWADPLEEAPQPTPVFFPGESHGQRSLAGCSPWGRKESDTTEATERGSLAG